MHKTLSFVFLCFLLLSYSSCARSISPLVSMSTFNFQVDNLNEYATLYCPKSHTSLQKQPRPLIILLHSGFGGDDSATHRFGQALAERGFCAIAPTYRGEKRAMDGQKSDGNIEFCLGEVHDVFTLIDQLKRDAKFRTQPLSLVGFSHGGCIALRVAQQRTDIESVVVFSAPVDAVATYEFVRQKWWKNFFFNGWLASRLRDFVGVTPDQNMATWRERSPLWHMQKFHSSLLFVHGLADDIVPVEQTYRLRDQLQKSGKIIVEKTFSEPCERVHERTYNSQHTPLKTELPKRKYEFLFFEEQGHIYSRKAFECTQDYAIKFIVERFTAMQPKFE